VFSLGLVGGRAGDEAEGVEKTQRTLQEGVKTTATSLGWGEEVSFR